MSLHLCVYMTYDERLDLLLLQRYALVVLWQLSLDISEPFVVHCNFLVLTILSISIFFGCMCDTFFKVDNVPNDISRKYCIGWNETWNTIEEEEEDARETVDVIIVPPIRILQNTSPLRNTPPINITFSFDDFPTCAQVFFTSHRFMNPIMQQRFLRECSGRFSVLLKDANDVIAMVSDKRVGISIVIVWLYDIELCGSFHWIYKDATFFNTWISGIDKEIVII